MKKNITRSSLKVGDQVAYNGVRENEGVKYWGVITRFEYHLIWVKNGKGYEYALNTWNISDHVKAKDYAKRPEEKAFA